MDFHSSWQSAGQAHCSSISKKWILHCFPRCQWCASDPCGSLGSICNPDLSKKYPREPPSNRFSYLNLKCLWQQELATWPLQRLELTKSTRRTQSSFTSMNDLMNFQTIQ